MKMLRTVILVTMCQMSLNASFGQVADKEKGSITEKRNIDPIDKITMSGGYVTVYHSDSPIIELTGSKSCLDLVHTSTSGKSLMIKVLESDRHENCKVNISVGTPSLSSVEQNGGGDILVKTGFGEQQEFHCTINGGGRVDVVNLNVKSFYASISGGGAIQLNATQTLNGKISGGGTIEYQGNPKVISDVSGGGRISRK